MALGVDVGKGPVDLIPGPGERRLDVGIIGAGIAGLGAAVALGQAGHNVEVSTCRLYCAAGSRQWHSLHTALQRVLRDFLHRFSNALVSQMKLVPPSIAVPMRPGCFDNTGSTLDVPMRTCLGAVRS